MVLSEFVGNEEVIYEISETMKNRLLPHAILIEGVKGSGKRSLARILAQYAVCSAEGDRPCGVCPACIKAEKGIHPDIVTADGSKAGELNIEAVRSIRSAAYIKPNEGENRVFLMHFCEKMLPAAQNAFLKVLEEPPQNVLFVLTAVSATSLLQTIRSRTRIYSLYPPSVTEAETVLKKMFPDKDAPGELLFAQLDRLLAKAIGSDHVLVHHQLPAGCKDYSDYYMKRKEVDYG